MTLVHWGTVSRSPLPLLPPPPTADRRTNRPPRSPRPPRYLRLLGLARRSHRLPHRLQSTTDGRTNPRGSGALLLCPPMDDEAVSRRVWGCVSLGFINL
jgi:hypothetical protein